LKPEIATVTKTVQPILITLVSFTDMTVPNNTVWWPIPYGQK